MPTYDGDPAVAAASRFRRSTFCAAAGCVEVALLPGDGVAVRDSKNDAPEAPVLLFDAAEWDAFLQGVRAGEFSREALTDAPGNKP